MHGDVPGDIARQTHGETTMCSHYVGCLQDVLGVEGNHLCRQVALTTSELEPLLSQAECLAVDEAAQKRWKLDMESKKAEGGSPALCCWLLTPCVPASGAGESQAQRRVPGDRKYVW